MKLKVDMKHMALQEERELHSHRKHAVFLLRLQRVEKLLRCV
jgi:hypothetical protein